MTGCVSLPAARDDDIKSDHAGALYVAHAGWLRSWLRKQLGCSHRAADLAHDTFVRVLGRRNAPALDEPRAYLTTIARGLLVDHWRRQALERSWLDTLAALPEPLAQSPEDTAIALQALRRIDALLDQLKPRVREAFLLAQLDGLTYRAIGAQLGVGERMVKKYMAEAMLHCLLVDLDPLA